MNNPKLRLKSATKKWDSMTKRERAVALAKDVISLVRKKRMVAKTGSYLATDKGAYFHCDDVASDARQFLANKKCHVCALGSLLVAKIDARNEVSLSDIGGTEYHGGRIFTGDTDCIENLRDAFTESQLTQLERAFEGWDSSCFDTDGKWLEDYPKDEDRLIALMQRVIDNGGTFTAKDVKNP